ncbi:bifunctional folylpolyglutamate synthase/dihydrofolate synthase [Limosilactobacillus mucosae]|uniref:tetrahydrofolate synthase n=1 Tax=Limosilactobacillus mucosae TaxID=97478 RepID=A0AAJ1HRZ8_LIMMU|nr:MULTISPECIES: folylpolyglutamate synthase/dihydrofolate synthase family protein [Lactobacillaceae]MDC2829462.1 bifunctional folylpolyglutamate synthase/dihydrofolate synthase [Limosilactobacillus mucosae]MDC2837145.1 bifunctional folylpolyglutamate synthase/dihydrofolate synthase [Limosilactobacillus mucosae]MDC2849360.1 bifunctional folylpolyglutamate synthase/dihydrofolate synthase [Limosilactobacillus mucosae]MDC2853057.1 bifunctional folylpolyglutamate synthase/dihydrofolate synthase [Li
MKGFIMTNIQNYDDALAFIHGRTKFKKIPTLKRMRRFLQELGNPQENLDYLHITGTNGKGSTTAMLRSMLMADGLSVGTFTSPFIVRFNERISLNGQPIPDDELVKTVQKVAPIVDYLDEVLPEGGPTEFEIDTAIMFTWFAKMRPDVVILEVGIGGLFDSTNVIVPKVSGIVSVGYDHMHVLGDTLGEIAAQKAGIIKPKVPVVIGRLPKAARQVIIEAAQDKQAPLYENGRQFTAKKLNDHQLKNEIEYDGLMIHRQRFQLGLLGEYQVDNAAVAITMAQLYLKQQGLPIDVGSFRQGLADTRWPGRLEVVNDSPLVVLDGAHNLPGMQALTTTIKDDFKNMEIYVLVAILADKQYQLMLGEIASLPNVHLMLTNFAGPGPKRPSADLKKAAQDIETRWPIKTAASWQEGLLKISKEASADDAILITGSLYFISEVRSFFVNSAAEN